MQVNLDYSPDTYTIRSYGNNSVSVRHPVKREQVERQEKPRESILTTSCIIFPDQLIDNWPATDVATLSTGLFTEIMEKRPEVLLLGTGNRIQFPATALTMPLLSAGIGVEVMDNGAACRTYNILMTEGRDVAVALIIAPPEGGRS